MSRDRGRAYLKMAIDFMWDFSLPDPNSDDLSTTVAVVSSGPVIPSAESRSKKFISGKLFTTVDLMQWLCKREDVEELQEMPDINDKDAWICARVHTHDYRLKIDLATSNLSLMAPHGLPACTMRYVEDDGVHYRLRTVENEVVVRDHLIRTQKTVEACLDRFQDLLESVNLLIYDPRVVDQTTVVLKQTITTLIEDLKHKGAQISRIIDPFRLEVDSHDRVEDGESVWSKYLRAKEVISSIEDMLREGSAHLCNVHDDAIPSCPDLTGWIKNGSGVYWTPCGPKLGWIDNKGIMYLETNKATYDLISSLLKPDSKTLVPYKIFWKQFEGLAVKRETKIRYTINLVIGGRTVVVVAVSLF